MLKSGLYNFRSRYYSPAIGRFLQPDPIGYATGDMNLYTYVGNDVANFTDPLGLAPLVNLLDSNGGTQFLTRDQISTQMSGNPLGFKPGSAEDQQLSRGCVGITSLYEGNYHGGYLEFPERYKNTKGYLDLERAINRSDIPAGYHNFVYAKQGVFAYVDPNNPSNDLWNTSTD